MAKRATHLEHQDVGPCGEDDAVDTEDAKEDVVRRDGVEPPGESPQRPWRLPVPVGMPRSTSMRGAEEIGRVESLDSQGTRTRCGGVVRCTRQCMSLEYACDGAGRWIHRAEDAIPGRCDEHGCGLEPLWTGQAIRLSCTEGNGRGV